MAQAEEAPSPVGDDPNEERRPATSPGAAAFTVAGFTIPELVNYCIGRPMLFFGLILVVLGRGCDATSLRSVGRAAASYNLARDTFKLEWDAKASALQQKADKKRREINDLTAGGKFGDPGFQKQLNDLQKEQSDLNKDLGRIRDDEQSARAEKDAGEWKPLREASMKARSGHEMSVYWYEWIFILGSMVLVLGILTLAFTGQGAEKWIAYIMIAILTFSIYVFGAAWIESLVSSFSGMAGPRGGF